jgi:MFS family permease
VADPSLTARADTVAAPVRISARAGYTLAMLTVIYGLSRVDRDAFGLLLPLIQRDLRVSDTALGLISGFAFTLFYSTLGVPIAWLADRWNRRNIVALGLGFWSLMTACMGLVGNVVQLALARFLLGAGEATCVAPSTSILADRFRREHRAFAMAVLAAANPLSILIAFPVIGWVAAEHGWRAAFLMLGAPGILVALFFYLTVAEPARGESDGQVATKATMPVRTTLAFLFQSRSYRLLLIGGAFVSINIHATQAWMPAFLTRVHDLNSQEVGAYIGAIRGPLGIAGALTGAWLVARLGKLDERWLVLVPGIACVLLCPADLILLFAGGAGWKVGLGADMFLSVAQVGLVLALLLGVVKIRIRAFATSLYLLIFGLVGNTLGPLVIGLANDALAPALGANAIRYSLLLAPLTALAAGVTFLSITRYYDADQRRATA